MKPYWGQKILTGEKIVEIRKSAPQRGKAPFLVYIYETKAGCGAVIGECVCYCTNQISDYSAVSRFSLLSTKELAEYAGSRKIYAWFLAKVVQYSEPRPLLEFGLKRAPQSWCYVRNPKLL
jgi:predicted transcriptional regulator